MKVRSAATIVLSRYNQAYLKTAQRFECLLIRVRMNGLIQHIILARGVEALCTNMMTLQY